MKNTKIQGSLVWRLSLALLGILILLGLSYVLITSYSARRYYQETTQRLNAHVAEHMLLEVNPFENGEVNEEALGKIMHSMMAVNPGLEVYLIDPSGSILSYVVLDKKVRLKSIDLSPVQKFLASEGQEFILGDDPRQPGETTIFSATEVREEGALLGYVYMVLASEKYENISEALAAGYFMRIGSSAFAITLIFAFGLGLLLIYFLTRSIRRMAQTMKSFADGNYDERIAVSRKDELAVIGQSFNVMADTIVKNMEDLKQVDKLRRELVANVSHDLRSPMAVINGYIETLVMKEDNLSAEQRRKYLDIVFRSSQKLNGLVSDLFELSKLESGQVQLEKERIALSEELAHISEEYRVLAAKKGVRIEADFAESRNLQVLGDVKMLSRVFHNLLDNAL
ncbi:MAG: HAMP domain-containing sensor histidine kinase, partial [Cryomorphaceae bacterium]